MTDDQILEQALRLPEEQRKPFLAEACGGNSAQMARLIGLLEADQRNDSLLDPAVVDSTPEHNPGTSLDMVDIPQLMDQP